MQDLPDEVVLLIFERCSGKTLAILELVCTRFRSLTRHVPTQIHITPSIEHDVVRWAKDRLVTKVSGRRVYDIPYFPTARVLDFMFARIPYRALPPCLRRVRIHRLGTTNRDPSVFKLSKHLPPSVTDVDITFESSWRRVDIDRGIRHVAIRAHPPSPFVNLRQPDILVTKAMGTETLILSTYGGITAVPHPTTIRRARIECEDNFDATNILKLFGHELDMLVLCIPNASILWSQDLAHIDPEIVAISCDFVGIDTHGPRLRDLELDVDRLAYIELPPSIHLNISVRHTHIDASFFR